MMRGKGLPHPFSLVSIGFVEKSRISENHEFLKSPMWKNPEFPKSRISENHEFLKSPMWKNPEFPKSRIFEIYEKHGRFVYK